MATIYIVQVVSHWQSYTHEQLQQILNDAVQKIENPKRNTIQVKVIKMVA